MPCLVEFGPVVLVKNILKIWKFHHCISAIAFLSLLENVHVSSFKRTWIPFTQGWFMPFRFKFVNVFSLDLCLVWSTRSVEEDFSIWIFKCVFSLYCYYLLLEKGVPFHLNKLEFHIPRNWLLRSLVQYLVQLFLRKRFQNLVNEFSLFVIIAP